MLDSGTIPRAVMPADTAQALTFELVKPPPSFSSPKKRPEQPTAVEVTLIRLEANHNGLTNPSPRALPNMQPTAPLETQPATVNASATAALHPLSVAAVRLSAVSTSCAQETSVKQSARSPMP